MHKDKVFLTILVPVYNEEEVLNAFNTRLIEVLSSLKHTAEILYVNDGSDDRSWIMLKQLKQTHPFISLLNLSRRFGKEIALTAGLNYARGEFVVIMDADLQHPPELIPQFLNYAKKGYDVVYAIANREKETWLKRKIAPLFYKIINHFTDLDIPQNASDFRLLSRRVVESLKQIDETHRFMKGLFAWVGFSQKGIHYKMETRLAGKTKWNYWKLWNFAIEGVTSFTITPLKFASYLGLFTSLIAFIYSLIIFGKTLLFGNPVQGYPSLMIAILFLGGIQLFTLGIIGEYLGRTFNESKRRPLYFVKDYLISYE